MGPRLFRRGNCRMIDRIDATVRASMGPRLFRRGNEVSLGQPRPGQVASMGPRLFRRGNGKDSALVRRWRAKLQWGHVFSDVEIEKGAPGQAQRRRASMGPRLFRRGNPGQDQRLRSRADRFNGATSFQTWKSPRRITRQADYFLLQWGHVFSDVEIADSYTRTV